jgi:hypothetical protein
MPILRIANSHSQLVDWHNIRILASYFIRWLEVVKLLSISGNRTIRESDSSDFSDLVWPSDFPNHNIHKPVLTFRTCLYQAMRWSTEFWILSMILICEFHANAANMLIVTNCHSHIRRFALIRRSASYFSLKRAEQSNQKPPFGGLFMAHVKTRA